MLYNLVLGSHIGGAIALAGAIALGPRLGRVFKRDGGGPPPPHDLIIGAVGGLILCFGLYGFNPGSTLSALDTQGIGRVAFNTGCMLGRYGSTVLFVLPHQEVGSRSDSQWLSGRAGRHHRMITRKE
jgi:ammonia channel protein AmtB